MGYVSLVAHDVLEESVDDAVFCLVSASYVLGFLVFRIHFLKLVLGLFL